MFRSHFYLHLSTHLNSMCPPFRLSPLHIKIYQIHFPRQLSTDSSLILLKAFNSQPCHTKSQNSSPSTGRRCKKDKANHHTSNTRRSRAIYCICLSYILQALWRDFLWAAVYVQPGASLYGLNKTETKHKLFGARPSVHWDCMFVKMCFPRLHLGAIYEDFQKISISTTTTGVRTLIE